MRARTRLQKPKGSTFADARTLGLQPCCCDPGVADPVPLSPPPTALHLRRPLFAQGPPSLRLPPGLSAFAGPAPQAEGVPACTGRKPFLCTLTERRALPSFRAPGHMGGHDCVLHRRPPEIGRWSRHHRVRGAAGPLAGQALTALPVPAFADIASRSLGAGPVPRLPAGPLRQEMAARAGAGGVGWDLPRVGFEKGNTPASAVAATTVDVYFSAGRRRRWTENNASSRSYSSCDDGNDRACSIWRVRVTLGVRIGEAERVYPAYDPGLALRFDHTYTQPAVSPDGQWVAFQAFHYTTYDPFAVEGTSTIRTAERDHDTGRLSNTEDLVSPPSYMGGVVADPAWRSSNDLLYANARGTSGVELKSTMSGDIYEMYFREAHGLGFTTHRVALSSPLRGPNLLAQYLGSSPTLLEDLDLFYTDASDPHGHDNVMYEGENRGRRVVAFGAGGEELPEADRHPGKAVSRVFDPDDVVVPGANSFETPELPTWGSQQMEGCHHPTWNPSGDLFQCSHQQSWFGYGPHTRALHGFRWRDGAWRSWDGGAGFLFPWSPTGYATTEDWWSDLPNALAAAWPELQDLLLESDWVDSAGNWRNPDLLFVWKYGYFAGSDQWVVAQFAVVDEDWAQEQWDVPDDDAQVASYRRTGQKLSRVVLINLVTGRHYDLTRKVEEALGLDEEAVDYTRSVTAIYPTATEPLHGVSFGIGGSVLHVPEGWGMGD